MAAGNLGATTELTDALAACSNLETREIHDIARKTGQQSLASRATAQTYARRDAQGVHARGF